MYFVILGMRTWWILRCDDMPSCYFFWLLSDYATSTVDSSVATIWQTQLIKYAALPSSLTQAITTWLKVGNKIAVTHMLLKKKKRLHKRMTMVASVSIRIFICFSTPAVSCPKTSYFSKSKVSSLSLLLRTSSFRPCHQFQRQTLLFGWSDSENTQDLTVTDDSLSAHCLNQGQSAFSLLPLLPRAHKIISATAAFEAKTEKI